MPEKSADVRSRQLRMVEARKAGNIEIARWWMRCAAEYRKRDAAEAENYYDGLDRVWWTPRPTRYVNG